MKIFELSPAAENRSERFEVPRPIPSFSGSMAPTFFSLAGRDTLFTVHMEASFSLPLYFSERPPKGRVFEDDCLEIFVRPQSSQESFFPAPFYYGWEIGAGGTLLEYRAGIGEEGRRIVGSGNGRAVMDGSGAKAGIEPVHGILHDTIVGTLISFDYDWKSRASFTSRIDEAKGLWTVDLSIPWSDFGLSGAPHGESWYFTVNRIDMSSVSSGGNPGLACLHDGIVEPRFHQPDLFSVLYIQ